MNLLLYVGVVAGSWIANRLSLRVAYAVAAIAGTMAYCLAGRPRRAIQGNLSVVLSRPPSSLHVRRTALSAFRTNARNWMDSIRLESTPKEEIERRVTVQGWDRLMAAQAQKRGVILIGAHLGNIDVVGQIVAARGLPITVPVEPIPPRALFMRVQRLRQSLGIRTVSTAGLGRELLRSLNDGQVVGILADRNISSGGVSVEVFGRQARVSRGPAWLVSHSDAPVFIGAGIRWPDGSFKGEVSILGVRRTGDRKADTLANAQLIMRAVEGLIRQHPEQWCMFASVWDPE